MREPSTTCGCVVKFALTCWMSPSTSREKIAFSLVCTRSELNTSFQFDMYTWICSTNPHLLCATLSGVIYITIVIVNNILITHVDVSIHPPIAEFRSWFQWMNSSSNISVIVAGNSISVTTPPTALLIDGRYRFLVQLYTLPVAQVAERQHLRSASRNLLVAPRFQLNTYGRRAFAVAAPATWNSLSDELRNPDLHSATFRRNLKPFLFQQYRVH